MATTEGDSGELSAERLEALCVKVHGHGCAAGELFLSEEEYNVVKQQLPPLLRLWPQNLTRLVETRTRASTRRSAERCAQELHAENSKWFASYKDLLKSLQGSADMGVFLACRDRVKTCPELPKNIAEWLDVYAGAIDSNYIAAKTPFALMIALRHFLACFFAILPPENPGFSAAQRLCLIVEEFGKRTEAQGSFAKWVDRQCPSLQPQTASDDRTKIRRNPRTNPDTRPRNAAKRRPRKKTYYDSDADDYAEISDENEFDSDCCESDIGAEQRPKKARGTAPRHKSDSITVPHGNNKSEHENEEKKSKNSNSKSKDSEWQSQTPSTNKLLPTPLATQPGSPSHSANYLSESESNPCPSSVQPENLTLLQPLPELKQPLKLPLQSTIVNNLSLHYSSLTPNQRLHVLTILEEELGIIPSDHNEKSEIFFDLALVRSSARIEAVYNYLHRIYLENVELNEEAQLTANASKDTQNDQELAFSDSTSSLSSFSSSDDGNDKPTHIPERNTQTNTCALPEYVPIAAEQENDLSITKEAMASHHELFGTCPAAPPTQSSPRDSEDKYTDPKTKSPSDDFTTSPNDSHGLLPGAASTAWSNWKGQALQQSTYVSHAKGPVRTEEERKAEGGDARI